jgi:hypothetical protein
MAPKKLQTVAATNVQGRKRGELAATYLEVATLIDEEDGAAVNVCIGLAVLAGIAASDAICISALGERYSGPDHSAAADLLNRVDSALATKLRRLVDLKPASHYGEDLLTSNQRISALRWANALVSAAAERTV